MRTIGHHTCKNKGGKISIEENAPFYAEHDPKNKKFQFLGSGYYFWDNNLELAKIWGKSHYDNNFAITECDFEISSSECYDLVGNRYHQIDLINRIDLLSQMYPSENVKNWTLVQIITFIKELEKEIMEYKFPYKFIRAIDLLNHDRYKKAQHLIQFNTNKENYTLINPKIILFAFNRQDILLDTKKVIFLS